MDTEKKKHLQYLSTFWQYFGMDGKGYTATVYDFIQLEEVLFYWLTGPQQRQSHLQVF